MSGVVALRVCSKCSSPAKYVCSACKSIQYCSQECVLRDWHSRINQFLVCMDTLSPHCTMIAGASCVVQARSEIGLLTRFNVCNLCAISVMQHYVRPPGHFNRRREQRLSVLRSLDCRRNCSHRYRVLNSCILNSVFRRPDQRYARITVGLCFARSSSSCPHKISLYAHVPAVDGAI